MKPRFTATLSYRCLAVLFDSWVDQSSGTFYYDAEHTYDYVIEMLEKLFALSTEAAWNHAVEVDTTGRTIVITCDLAAAEFGRDQIHGFGADWRMPNSKGSMSAIVEPCAG